MDGTQKVPADYKEISFVCLRPDGCLELPSTLGIVCRTVSKKLEGFEGFHFHQLRHTYTSNLLSNRAAPKDVQELLGHSDVSTTMNVYAHSTRKEKRDSARLLDKVAGNDKTKIFLISLTIISQGQKQGEIHIISLSDGLKSS